MFWESISFHTHAFFPYIKCFEVRFPKKKNQVFSLKSCFFQNFDWSNLIFDQSNSCFKNSVSLCLVRLIEPVFRSIKHRISGFLKKVPWLFQTSFSKSFSTFSLSLRFGKAALKFFVVFFLNFCKVFLPQGR